MTIAALAVATSCGKSDTPAAASGPVDVRLVVSSGDNTRVGSDETDNDICQLRVYAFNAYGKKVGYAEADNLQGQNYIPITLSEGGYINFYVIANDNFGPKPVTDWTSLSKTDLESLKFDLSGFTGVRLTISSHPCRTTVTMNSGMNLRTTAERRHTRTITEQQ